MVSRTVLVGNSWKCFFYIHLLSPQNSVEKQCDQIKLRKIETNISDKSKPKMSKKQTGRIFTSIIFILLSSFYNLNDNQYFLSFSATKVVDQFPCMIIYSFEAVMQLQH